MALIVIMLLLAVLLGGFGFAIHALWYVAALVLIVWVLGFLFRGSGDTARWYRW